MTRHEHRLRNRASRAGIIDAHLPEGVIEMPDTPMKDVVAARPALARDIAMPIARADSPLVDSRILTSLVAQSLHVETSWLRPIELPPSQQLRGAATIGRRAIGERKQRHLLLANVGDNPVVFIERVHQMPRHAPRPREPPHTFRASIARHDPDLRTKLPPPRNPRCNSHRAFYRYRHRAHRDDHEVSRHREIMDQRWEGTLDHLRPNQFAGRPGEVKFDIAADASRWKVRAEDHL